MTKRDFFRIIIKLFGLYSLILALFSFIPNNISNILFNPTLELLLIVAGATFVSVGLFLVLLFRTNAIINALKLDSGFDDEKIVIGNFDNQSILKFAVILIGGFLLVDNIAGLLFDLVNYFKFKGTSYTIEGAKVNYAGITVSAINVVIGYLFLANYKTIARFLDK